MSAPPGGSSTFPLDTGATNSVTFSHIPTTIINGKKEEEGIVMVLKNLVGRTTGLQPDAYEFGAVHEVAVDGIKVNQVQCKFEDADNALRFVAINAGRSWDTMARGALKDVRLTVDRGKGAGDSAEGQGYMLILKIDPRYKPSFTSIHDTLRPFGPILSIILDTPLPPQTGEVYITFSSLSSLLSIAELSRASLIALTNPCGIEIVPIADPWPTVPVLLEILKDVGLGGMYNNQCINLPGAAIMVKKNRQAEPPHPARYTVEVPSKKASEMAMRVAKEIGYTSAQGVKFNIQQASVWGSYPPKQIPISVPLDIFHLVEDHFDRLPKSVSPWMKDHFRLMGEDVLDGRPRSPDRRSGDDMEGLSEYEADQEWEKAGEKEKKRKAEMVKAKGKVNAKKDTPKKRQKTTKKKSGLDDGYVKDGSKWVRNGMWGAVKTGKPFLPQGVLDPDPEVKEAKDKIEGWREGVVPKKN